MSYVKLLILSPHPSHSCTFQGLILWNNACRGHSITKTTFYYHFLSPVVKPILDPVCSLILDPLALTFWTRLQWLLLKRGVNSGIFSKLPWKINPWKFTSQNGEHIRQYFRIWHIIQFNNIKGLHDFKIMIKLLLLILSCYPVSPQHYNCFPFFSQLHNSSISTQCLNQKTAFSNPTLENWVRTVLACLSWHDKAQLQMQSWLEVADPMALFGRM